MRLNKWNGPNEVRYYFDLKFGGCNYLSGWENRALIGRWIGSDADGKAVSFKKTQTGYGACRGEEGEHLDKRLGYAGMMFADFQELYNRSLTPAGNFSEARFFKELDKIKPGN